MTGFFYANKCAVSFLCQPLAVGAVRFLPAFFISSQSTFKNY